MLNLRSRSTQLLMLATILVAAIAMWSCATPGSMTVTTPSVQVTQPYAVEAQIVASVSAARTAADNLLLSGRISVDDAKRANASADGVIATLKVARATGDQAQVQAAASAAAALTSLIATWSTK